ncbi:RICIN domain-containing protein [Streptomyces caatingaensis]|uniref:Ricin B lectin domain-containing protein n=1 Tax=Streptomyces caatingaensis TaxID=1678637 RepID=A0A0K9X963_9ACTN|nr:RICIN domain-containing protein [Streptomyces caatingaensis]KNB49733.1 hypothetical protein AC230_23380 [Streptomyces caatingaensis]
MSAPRKFALVLATAGLAAGGFAATAGSAHAAPQAHTFRASVQNYADDTNLDEYYGHQRGAVVLTRDAREAYQVFTFTSVGNPASGKYTIKGSHFGLCLAAKGPGQQIQQEACDVNKLSQQWKAGTVEQPTRIESVKFPGQVLQGNGLDRSVVTNQYTARSSQLWTLYTKD